MCDGNPNVFISLWRGLFHHVVNEHEWVFGDGFIEPRCDHGELEADEHRQWLTKGYAAHSALVKVILDKTLLKNIPYYVNFRHTGNIESFHSFKLMYASKRFAYSPTVYRARCLLAAIDFNHQKDRPVSHNEAGNPRYHRKYSKRASNWALAPIKQTKDYSFMSSLIYNMVKARLDDKGKARQKRPLDQDDPRMIAGTMAKTQPEPTSVIAKKQKTRF